MLPIDPRAVFDAVDITGVVANALLGGAVARSRKFDLIGFLILGICTGLGGGAVRDVLLGLTPVALTHPAYLPAAVATSCAAYLLNLDGRWSQRVLTVADVLALGCWAATGASKALGVGLGWLPALMVGVLTACGGGIIRDVLVGRPPAIFGGNTLYASVALLGAGEMLLAHQLGRPTLGMALSIASCGALALLARWRGWALPGAVSLNDAVATRVGRVSRSARDAAARRAVLKRPVVRSRSSAPSARRTHLRDAPPPPTPDSQ